jgi:GT2 family glycosyltransferase
VSVVIVSYNTRDVLRACLAALLRSETRPLEIFVVDNGSQDGSVGMVQREFPAVTAIANIDNRGFAAANNLALVRTQGTHVLLLNPDCFVRPDTIGCLMAFLDAHAEVGIVGPMVLNGDGTLQSCGYRYPSLTGEIRQSKNIGRLLRWALGPEPEPFAPDEPHDVEWVDGCCLMIRRATLERIGPLDEQYFLYAEELDWCRSALRAGYRIAVCPSGVAVHLRGTSSEQVRDSSLALLVETKLRYFRKHDGLLIALAVSTVYLLGFLKQWRHEPVKNRAKMRGVLGWWRALLTPASRRLAPSPRT